MDIASNRVIPSKEEQEVIIKGLLYQSAIERELEQRGKPEHLSDYILVDQMLSEINRLGFDFRYLYDIERLLITNKDIVNIILGYLGRFDNDGITAELVSSIGYKGNKFATAGIIEAFNDLVQKPGFRAFLTVFYDNAFNRLKDKRYIDEYLKWAANPDIAKEMPFTMRMLGSWKLPEAKELFMGYLQPDGERKLMSSAMGALAKYKNDEDAKAKIHAMQQSKNKVISDSAKNLYEKMNK